MIDPKTTTEKASNDNFAVIEQINKKYFSEIEHSVPHLQQTLFDLQNECYKTWKNAVNTNISLQKEFVTKTGFNFILPETAYTIIDNTSKEILKYKSLCNKITITTIESIKKNTKIWNDNANMFLDLNRKIMQYWLSAFIPK